MQATRTKTSNAAAFDPNGPVAPAQEKAGFHHVFEDLVGDLRADFDTNFDIPEVTKKWVDDMTRYNVLGGKMNRGLSVIAGYRALKGTVTLTPEEFKKAAVLGWCVEWLQACFLVADDIMDSSITRRGQPCWYKQPSVGHIAINDSFILESSIYALLKVHFKDHEAYGDLVELFRDVTYKTDIGQNLDLITAPEDEIDLNRFSMDRYRQIVKYKTAYYSFQLPVALAMRLHGITDPKLYKVAESILLEIGEFFQIQDDFLDCYGDPKVIGKIGTDIEDNKCGWLINQALLICNQEQRDRLDANYGKRTPEAVAIVKSVYEELDLKSIYTQYEQESYDRITKQIESLKTDIPPQVFLDFVAKIYKRDK